MHEEGGEEEKNTPWRLHQCFGVEIQIIGYQEA